MLGNISISKSMVENKPKVYTYGFESVCVESLKHLSELANNYSVSVPTYNNGHRTNSNIIDGGNYIMIDCDKEGQAEYVEVRIRQYDYVKVPSQSCEIFPYKFHYILPTQSKLSNTQAGIKYQIQKFLSQCSIDSDMIDYAATTDAVRQFAPAIVKKYKHTKGTDTYVYGLDSDEAEDLTKINDTGLQVPLIQDIPEDYKINGIDSKFLSRKPKESDADLNSFDNIKNNILDRNKSVYYLGKQVSLDEIEAMVFMETDKAGQTIVSGFGCPCCNSKHSGDYTKGYGFAFIGDDGAMVIRCTGNECAENPNYKLPIKFDSDSVVFSPVEISDEDVAISNSFKTRWETILDNVSNPRLEKNWKQNFSVFRTVIEHNLNQNDTMKFICPSPTGSGKSQQIIHQSINLYKTDIKTLIVVMRTADADNIAKQIQVKTSSGYVSVFHRSELTEEVTLNKESQCLIITHSMFLQHPDIVDEKDFIVIDEAIDAVNHYSISKQDLHILISIAKENKIDDLFILRCKTFLDFLNTTDVKNNNFRSLFGNNNDLEFPEPSLEFIEAIKTNKRSYAPKRFKLTASQIAKVNTELIELSKILPLAFNNWTYITNEKNEISMHTAIEIIANKSVVIMDATATVNSLYKLYSRYQKNLIVVPKIECRSYSNVKLYKTNRLSTGKTTLTKDEKYVKGFAETVKANVVDTDKVLVVVHNDNENKIQSYLPNNVSVNHFGNLTGTNKYNQCNKIFIFGLNHKPRIVHINNHTLSKGVSALQDNDINKRELAEVVASDLSAEVIQAINRIRCRKPIDDKGNCEPCEVYLTLPANTVDTYYMIEHIQNEMSDIIVSDIEFEIKDSESLLKRYKLVENFINQLTYMCKKDELKEGVTEQMVRYELEIDNEQLRQIRKSPTFKKLIPDLFDIEEKFRKGSGGRLKKTKDKYYFLIK